LGEALRNALWDRISRLGLAAGAPVFDAGCGEGYYLSSVCERVGLQGWGADISVAAIDAAARAHPRQHWIVANADRQLPFVAGAFPLILSITARKNPQEFKRLLDPRGRLLVAVAAEDDQTELRAAMFGQSLSPDRAAATAEAFQGTFVLEDETTVRSRARMDADGLRDLLKGSYRGERYSAQEKLAGLSELDVTSSYRLMCFRPV
jgi:23S rRNA (guanine745-N1)-methyltransferase